MISVSSLAHLGNGALHLTGWSGMVIAHLSRGRRRDLLAILAELFHDALDALVELRRYVERRIGIYVEATFGLSEVHLVVELTDHDLFVLVVLEPFDALALLPEAKFSRLAWHDIVTESMLFAAAPVA